jgi:hypothetical protein
VQWFALFVFSIDKGRTHPEGQTIRKVMGEGGTGKTETLKIRAPKKFEKKIRAKTFQ